MESVEALVSLLERAAARPDDAALQAELQRRVGEALDAHRSEVERACRRWIGDPQRAAELAQDVLEVATRRLPEFRGDSSLRTWLHRIVRYTCLRALAKRQDVLAEDGLLEAADDGTGVLSELKRHERVAILREVAAEVLDEIEQEAVELRYVHDVGQADVGRILGQSGRVLLQRCRRKLERGLRARAEALGHGSSLFRRS